MKNFIRLLASFFLLISIKETKGQLPVTTSPTDTIKLVDIIHADRLRFMKPDSMNELTIAAGNVVFRDNKTLFYADSVVHNRKLHIVEAFGNVHINDADTVNT